MAWDKETLTKLYTEGHTLQEIGNLFGVSRERIRQVMVRLGVPRDRCGRRSYHKAHKGGTRFISLDDYLRHSAVCNLSRNFESRTVKKYLPDLVNCAECARRENKARMHIHHIVYPALSKDDIQILCPSCHKIKHMSGLLFTQQVSIYNRYMEGDSVAEIARDFKVVVTTVMAVIRKIGNGINTMREAVQAKERANIKGLRELRAGHH